MSRPVISKEETLVLLRTPPSAYTLTLLREWLAHTMKRNPRFPAEAIIDIPEEFRNSVGDDRPEGEWDVRWAPNWSSVRSTTVGRFLVNNLVFSRSKQLRQAIPYVDSPFDGGTIKKVQQLAMDARLDGRIDSDDLIWMIDRFQWIGYAPTNFIAPSMTIDTIRMPKSVAELKKKILSGERGDRIRGGDLKELAATEKELISAAKSELEGKDPGLDIYNSGARGSFSNNFKNTAIMRGALRKSDDPSVIRISTSSLEEGISAKEMPMYADLIVQASYGRSMMTAQGGYIAKQLNAAFQTIYLSEDPESDCGTEHSLTVEVDNPREYLYRFVKTDKNALIEITPETAAEFKGRVVKLRSPLFCGGKDGICSRCAGTMYYRMGVKNIGLLAGRIGTTLMNASLKAFHDSSLKMKRITLKDYVKEL